MINGYTRLCGLIGNPVEHTMSPAIHNFLAEKTGYNLAYMPFHVETGRLEAAVKGAFALNALGVNVTVPYKSDVIPYLQDIDDLASRIGAVNTLVRTREGYKGYNTDMPGLLRALKADGVQLDNQNIVILGAGGVARAVAMLFAEENVASITILNRTIERAEAIAEEVNRYKNAQLIRVLPLADYKELSDDVKYVVIQTTNVGMYPNTEEAVIEDVAFYQKVSVGYDLIFNPFTTKFMKLVSENGGESYNGLKMLLYQGIIAYELWTGLSIDDALADLTYENMLQEMQKK